MLFISNHLWYGDKRLNRPTWWSSLPKGKHVPPWVKWFDCWLTHSWTLFVFFFQTREARMAIFRLRPIEAGRLNLGPSLASWQRTTDECTPAIFFPGSLRHLGKERAAHQPPDQHQASERGINTVITRSEQWQHKKRRAFCENYSVPQEWAFGQKLQQLASRLSTLWESYLDSLLLRMTFWRVL